jgi:hypothetical protein
MSHFYWFAVALAGTVTAYEVYSGRHHSESSKVKDEFIDRSQVNSKPRREARCIRSMQNLSTIINTMVCDQAGVGYSPKDCIDMQAGDIHPSVQELHKEVNAF